MEIHIHSTYGTALDQGAGWKYGQGGTQKISDRVQHRNKGYKRKKNKLYADIVIHINKKQHYVTIESIPVHPIQNDDVRTNV